MPESKKRLTWLVMLGVFLLIVLYDIAAYLWFPEATISGLTHNFVGRHQGAALGVCLATGYLLGHLFWPQYRDGK
jgi:hypothetical protein